MILKLKRTPGLYLIGFMASGKTTVGNYVADELGWGFFDVDAEIERLERRSIAELFLHGGEDRFRELESQMLGCLVSQIQAGHPCVVATGGGAFAQQRNWDIVENNGVTVWLDCALEVIETRLPANDPTRPLAKDRAAMRELFAKRRPLYARADFQIDANCEDHITVGRKILELPIF